jgi:hypothetical protein
MPLMPKVQTKPWGKAKKKHLADLISVGDIEISGTSYSNIKDVRLGAFSQLRGQKFLTVIGHGLMLSLSIAKWHNLLNSQSPVYDGDRQAPPDLSNLLPEGADSDPGTWLMHHGLMLACLRRIANASNIQPNMFP